MKKVKLTIFLLGFVALFVVSVSAVFAYIKSSSDDKVIAVSTVIQSQAMAISALPLPELSVATEKSPLDQALGLDRFKYLGWWGQINANSVVMSAPSTRSRKLASFSAVNTVKVLKEVSGETINGNSLWYQIDGGTHPGAYVFSGNVTPMVQPEPPAEFSIPPQVNPGDYWVDVNLTKKVLTLFLYDKSVFATYVTIGVDINPTIHGTYRIWEKLLKTRMTGRPPQTWHYYDLPNVPYVLYYNGGRALHGTYWHDQFATQKSSGCTNLTQGDAKFLYEKLDVGNVVYNHY